MLKGGRMPPLPLGKIRISNSDNGDTEVECLEVSLIFYLPLIHILEMEYKAMVLMGLNSVNRLEIE